MDSRGRKKERRRMNGKDGKAREKDNHKGMVKSEEKII